MNHLRTLKHTLFMLIIIGLNSCATIPEVSQEVVAIDFQLLKKGTLMGGGQEEIEAGVIPIKDKNDWEEFLQKANKINQHIEPSLVNQLDFESDMIIAVFDEVRSSGGYTFEIDHIDRNGSEHLIYITSKAPEGSSISVLTQPYELVTLSKTNNRFRIILQ